MTSSLVLRLSLVAVAAFLLIAGLVDAVRGEGRGILDIAGAGLILAGVVLEASGSIRLGRAARRRRQVVAATTAEMRASRSAPSSDGPGSALRSRTALK